MPSLDERREVAARLRDAYISGCAFATFFEFDCGDFETCQECSEYCTKHLADLIEPERTCRNLSPSKSIDGFLCSECGLEVYGGVGGTYVDESGERKRIAGPFPWRHCPYCEAKVIE